jgi:N-acyl-D-amino-acid deacylase
MDSALRQGVTTVVVGNCGASAWPRAGLADLATSLGTTVDELAGGWGSAAEYLAAVDAAGPACNVATLAGFGSLRSEVMGHERRAATPTEVDAMRRLLAEAMQAGALGLSTGLIYVPDMYASTDEVAAVATAVAPCDGIYTTHMRAEGRLLFTRCETWRSDGEPRSRPRQPPKLEGASPGAAPTAPRARLRRQCVNRPVPVHGVETDSPRSSAVGVGRPAAGDARRLGDQSPAGQGDRGGRGGLGARSPAPDGT